MRGQIFLHVQEGFTPQGVPFCSLPKIATNIMKQLVPELAQK